MCAETHPTAGGAGGPEPSGVELLDVKQVADLLHCSARTVQRHVGDGLIPPPVRIGRLVRWRAAEIDNWLDAGCPPMADLRGDREEVSR